MITVVGGSGFVGGHLVRRLESVGTEHWAPGRQDLLDGRHLGDVVYCAGVTTDFRGRPLDTVDAHVGSLSALLRTAELSSLVYLSSTRLYRTHGRAAEDGPVSLVPADPDHLYDLSKALGEALALSWDGPVLVLRLAHVYGVDLESSGFLPSVLRDAIEHGSVTLRTSLESTRNSVSLDDVVDSVLALSRRGARGIFNIAGPGAVSHRELTEELVALTGCEVHVEDGAPTERAPDISLDRVMHEIGYRPQSVLEALPQLVEGYRKALGSVVG